jgi:hypothetical protein
MSNHDNISSLPTNIEDEKNVHHDSKEGYADVMVLDAGEVGGTKATG